MTAAEMNLLNGKLYEECVAYALTLTQNATTARDLVQEAYYCAYKNRRKFESGTNLKAWIRTIVYNTFVTGYRLERRRQGLFQQAPRENHWLGNTVSDNPAPSDLEAGAIHRMIDGLSDIYRRPFLLQLRGMPYDQIARSLDLPIGTVKSRVFTARKRLKARIKQNYQELEAGE